MKLLDSTPIIVGVGQAVSHWQGDKDEAAPTPLNLAVTATEAALRDTGAQEKLIASLDTVIFVRIFQDSLPSYMKPANGRYENLPGSLAQAISIEGAAHIYSHSGGDQPQKMVNEYAEALFKGETKAVLLSGAEATGAVKTARRNRIKLDWTTPSNLALEDRGLGGDLLTEFEIANGLGFPVQTYPIFDNAYRHRCGLDRESYQHQIAELFAPFSKVAAKNPYAQFPTERSVEFLAEETKDNFRINDSYLKWHVAQDAVNQGASVILTTVGAAREFGISEEKWIYLHGYGQADDVEIARRADFSQSNSIALSIDRALNSAGVTAGNIDVFDIYSCFPSVVFIAAENLGIDWRKKPLTVTGGLPYFGGAGNNYSMHAIASMVEKLREQPTAKGLVLANGGFISKHAVGIYSAIPKEDWKPVSSEDLKQKIEEAAIEISKQSETSGKIETYTVSYGRLGPEGGMVIARTPSGRKFARFKSGHRATMKAFLDKPEPMMLDVALDGEIGKHRVSALVPIATPNDDR